VISVALLVLTGHVTGVYVTAAIVGLIVLAIAVGLLAAVFASEQLARKVGSGFGRAASAVKRLFRKPPVTGGADRAAKFRHDTIGLVRLRWLRLTLFTILSQLALFFVLLLSLRHMGVSESEISTAEAFAVYAFSRLLSAVPITPGGVGVIDLGYIGGLVNFDSTEKAQIVAAVLLFRLLTFGIQIPLGAFTYLIWQHNKSWRRDPPDIDPIEAAIQAKGASA
jgi:uncharacterized membrane protein YbhN (UPF0104 family)